MSGEAVAAPAVAAPAPVSNGVTPPPAAEAKAPVAEAAEFEIIVDGKKEMLTRAQALTRLQKSSAADKRLEEATRDKTKYADLLKELETDTEAGLRKAGKDPDKLLAAYLARKAKLELMTPEQQAAVKAAEEHEATKAELERLKAERLTEAQAALDQKNTEAVQAGLVSIAEKYDLPKTPETLEALATIAMQWIDELGVAPNLDQLAQEFMRLDDEHLLQRETKILPRLKGDKLKTYLKGTLPALLALPAADLLEILGPAGLKTIQAATLTKVPSAAKKPLAVVAPAPVPPKVPPRGENGRYLTEADIDKKYRR